MNEVMISVLHLSALRSLQSEISSTLPPEAYNSSTTLLLLCTHDGERVRTVLCILKLLSKQDSINLITQPPAGYIWAGTSMSLQFARWPKHDVDHTAMLFFLPNAYSNSFAVRTDNTSVETRANYNSMCTEILVRVLHPSPRVPCRCVAQRYCCHSTAVIVYPLDCTKFGGRREYSVRLWVLGDGHFVDVELLDRPVFLL